MNVGYDLVKGGDIQVGIIPKDIAAAANTGAWASMQSARRLHILVALAAGTSGEHVTLELEQAQNASGTGAKVLQIKKLYYKAAADIAATQKFTEVTTIDRQNGVNSYVSSGAGVATLQMLFVIVVHADDLDLANGFTHVRFKCADPGTARTGAVLHIADAVAYAGADKAFLI
jgi:hypothetical protein